MEGTCELSRLVSPDSYPASYTTLTIGPLWIDRVATTDLSPTLKWNPQGGVDLGYTVADVAPSRDSTVALYWSKDGKEPLGGPIPGTTKTIRAGKSPGTYGPFTFDAKTLGKLPPGAAYLLGIVDREKQIPESKEDNNIAALRLPTVKVTALRWNINRGKGVTQPQRGVDYAYSISAADLPRQTGFAFFWAKLGIGGKHVRLSAPLPIDSLTTSTIDKLRGFFGQNQDGKWQVVPPNNQVAFNMPGRLWGKPPVDATELLFVIDPDSKVIKSAQAISEMALPLHSVSAIFSPGSLNAYRDPKDRGGIIGTFRPGAGRFTLSEAEVRLGVDHFNWLQKFHGPGNWQFQDWKEVAWNIIVDRRGKIITTTPQVDPDPALPGSPRTFRHLVNRKPGGLIVRTTLTGNVPDSIVQASDNYNDAQPPNNYFVKIDGHNTNDVVYAPVWQGFADSFAPYINERRQGWSFPTLDTGVHSWGGTLSANEFKFGDRPVGFFELADPRYGGVNYYMSFSTKLVGISREPGTPNAQVVPINIPGTGFTWKSNSISTSRILITTPIPGYHPTILSGGVFGISFNNKVTRFTVQHGQIQRSYVRYLDLAFEAAVNLPLSRLKLTRFDLNGVNPPTRVNLAGAVRPQGDHLLFDFGPKGLSNGLYVLAVDTDGDGVFETKRTFHRLFCDMNGDGQMTLGDMLSSLLSLFRTAGGYSSP